MIHYLPRWLLLLILTGGVAIRAEEESIPKNLSIENLVPWCIVPFDAKKRSPAERAEMLVRLGLKRCAYDWRPNHVAEFEEEIRQYQRHGIEFFAFWGGHEAAYSLFEKYNIRPRIWKTLGSPTEGTREEKVAAAADSMEALAKRTGELGCPLGLYNHGGWGGEPENLVAVCQLLRKRGHHHVGIVYNWHHGHGHIDDWAETLELLKPYLQCLNLNGMDTGANPKILTLGQGEHDRSMLKTLIASGYDGPVGILDHQNQLDSEEALRDNLNGLSWLIRETQNPGANGSPPQPKAKPILSNPAAAPPRSSSPKQVDGPEGKGKALAGGVVIPGAPGLRAPPITVECFVRLESADHYNILIASETKSRQSHWEIFSMKGSGYLTAYLPGAKPDHIRSKKSITDKQWHQVAMQYGKNQISLWVDGEKVAEETVITPDSANPASGKLAFGRLVEKELGTGGTIDEVRIRKGIHLPGSDSGDVIGRWDFENLSELKQAVQVSGIDRKPLEPNDSPYWNHPINRDRVYDFYAKQALAGSKTPEPFPGLDGGTHGHWGNQNDQTTWKDGRVSATDHGRMVSGVFKANGKKYPRVVSVRLKENLNAAFDLDSLQFIAAWEGDLVKWSAVRRGIMHGIPMGGKPVDFISLPSPSQSARYEGLYRVGTKVVFAFQDNDKRYYRSVQVEGNQINVVEEVKPVPSESQWPDHIVTKGEIGKESPYAIDTLTLPYENPYRSLFFVSGVDFLSESKIAICTIHGEVWICEVSDADLAKLKWKRFAAGLHQPLGLKVVDQVIHVMCRDQITALHDQNGDQEADFHECVSRAQNASAGAHDFITGLQRDKQGRWYFASGNEGVCRVSADGTKLTQLATGLRNPNGLGISPDGKVVLSSVQEGSWTPASAICDVSFGGHFGAGGPREGNRGYVPPMLYLPRGVDNSSGGQCYIDSQEWGPVEGQWIHFSGGFAKHFLVLREEIDGGSQAAAMVLPGSFLSGGHRGRFSPFDGQLYVGGAQGWGNYGISDGCLQRVRFTGTTESYPYPIAWETRHNGIILSFASPMSDEIAEVDKWFTQQWNYRYGPAYGSPEYSVTNPERTGHDRLEIRSIQKLEGGKKWFIEIPQLQPVNQLHLHFNGDNRLEFFATIHQLGEAFTDFSGYEPTPKSYGITEALTDADSMDSAVLMTACAACHHKTQQVVGPPLSEIKQRYANNPQGIVKWAMNPQNKNPQLPPMPSFSFLGEEKLRIIADAILSATD